MNSKKLVLRGVVAALALYGVVAQAEPLKANVIHWWTSGGESAAVKVFRNCRWQRTPLATAEGMLMVYDGIDAKEIIAVADLVGIDQAERERMLIGVRIMEAAAKPMLNAM